MTKTYKQSLIRISLTSEHWQTLYDLARLNQSSIADLASQCLSDAMQRLNEEAAYIDMLQKVLAEHPDNTVDREFDIDSLFL